MDGSTGYILCATPRTGSTFLCSLLASTGVLGRPESYFREPDEVAWATRFGLETAGNQVRSYEAFVDSVRDAATTENGVLGARIMWGSLDRLVGGIGRARRQSDSTTLQAALGPLAFVHLVREDVVGQAVSWARAEQSGYWHQGDVIRRPVAPDVARMVALVKTIQDHNASWQAWFATNDLRPCVLTYEALTSDPGAAVGAIADLVGATIPPAWRPGIVHRKQADEVNAEWAELLRSALGNEDVG
ncbi:Stf0 family sulfotransferase [Nocardioides sp.]|uniref:Stf0 family sulfotransferase n=1 Tax=Nocardioides sp. TaxID=35761 RepID=UPI002D7EAAF3|nr:Stf0 family sulfotransferase [Nocardioides sp.]